MKNFNTEELIQDIEVLNTLTNEGETLNKAITSQRELVFHKSLNDILDTYITAKASNTIIYSDYITEATGELREATDRKSIVKIIDIIEFCLYDTNIKHNKISYEVARKLFDNKDSITTHQLKEAVKSEDYNKALNKAINQNKKTNDELIVRHNKPAYDNFIAMSKEELELQIKLATLALKNNK